MGARVDNPFDTASDESMPSLLLALDPKSAKHHFKRALPRLSGPDGTCRVKGIRVIRHKPGRRCVIEYDLRIEEGGKLLNSVSVIGKIRARRFGNEAYRLLDNFWSGGFDDTSTDGISVPEPLGVIPALHMWCQKKVSGDVSTDIFIQSGGIPLAEKVAVAAAKIHRAKVAIQKTHTIADELRILHQCMGTLADSMPHLSTRNEKLLAGCQRLGDSLPTPNSCGIHRDFYPEQIIVAPDGRLYVLDFDLYCHGDPALDIGNFLGHLTEESLRCCGRLDALRAVEQAMEDKFVELSGESVRSAVHGYHLLTLVRHVYLSTKFPERQSHTEVLLIHCEEQLAARGFL